jgi:hypothetical protein
MAHDPNSPRALVSVPNEGSAAGIVTALAEQGIQASVTGGFTAGFQAEAPGQVQVVVRLADLERAKQALAELHEDEEEVDWSQVDVGSPEDSGAEPNDS